MTLEQYLSENSESEAAFGMRVGASQAAVNRWVHGIRTPSRKFILAINEATQGVVTPADWYATQEPAA